METTPASSLTRYRPVVLAITGFAAAYGAFLVYKNIQISSPVSAPGIHRSNAIHRARRPTRPSRIPAQEDGQTEQPTTAEEALSAFDFGAIENYGSMITRDDNERDISIDLRPDGLPTLVALQEEHGMSLNQAQRELRAIHRDFVLRFMLMHFHDRDQRSSAETELHAAARWLRQLGIPQEEVRWGSEQFLRVEELGLTTGDGDTAERDEVDTIAGTEVGVQFRGDQQGLNLKQLLYHIAETQARQESFLHRGFRCDSCGTSPIRGIRWKCANCVDLDLCNECHATCMHARNHIFYEIKIPTYSMNNLQPVQEISYPGKADLSKTPPLPGDLCKELVEKSDMEKSEIEGLYEQFVCLATSPIKTGGEAVHYAIDRETFPHIISALSTYSPMQLNLVFDRLFAMFDTDHDNLISFEEFVMGVVFLRNRTSKKDRWRKTFEAYDIDGDGFIDRVDCLRMFRALFQIQKDLTMDFMSKNEAVNGLRDATAFAHTGRVISAAFNQSPRTVGEPRGRLNKPRNEYGDVRHQSGRDVMKENGSFDSNHEAIIGNAWESQAQLPFDHKTGEPLSLRDFLYLAPRDSRGHAPSHIARDQRVHFTYDGKPIREARNEALNEHHERRSFYDSSSLYNQPRLLEVGDYEIPAPPQDIGKDLTYAVLESALNELLDPLFKDKEDLHIESVGAGDELETYKKEIDDFIAKKEAIKQAADDPLMAIAAAAEEAAVRELEEEGRQQGIRELANGHPIGVEIPAVPQVESMDRAVVDLEAAVRAQPLDELLDGEGFSVRSDAPSPEETHALPVQPSEETQALPMQSPEITIQEATATHLDISTRTADASSQSYVDRLGPPSMTSVLVPSQGGSNILVDPGVPTFDPTMPQFRPNSEKDIRDALPVDVNLDPLRRAPEPEMPQTEDKLRAKRPKFEADIIKQFEQMFLGWERNSIGLVRNSATRKAGAAHRKGETTDEKPSDERLARLVELRQFKEGANNGQTGLNYQEFEKFLQSARGSDFKFLEGWLEVCYF